MQYRFPILLFCYPCKLIVLRGSPEIEFLNISLTKDSSLLLHAIHLSFYWLIYSSVVLNILTKNSRNKKTKQKLESEKTRVYSQKPRLKIPFKNSIWSFIINHYCICKTFPNSDFLAGRRSCLWSISRSATVPAPGSTLRKYPPQSRYYYHISARELLYHKNRK